MKMIMYYSKDNVLHLYIVDRKDYVSTFELFGQQVGVTAISETVWKGLKKEMLMKEGMEDHRVKVLDL